MYEKLILLGNSNVGKSSLFKTLSNQEFSKDTITTIGVEFGELNINFRDTQYILKCWDTAGQEKYKSLISNYYRNISFVIFVFDLNNTQSFNDIEYWIQEFKQMNKSKHVKQLLLVGNKSDLPVKVPIHKIQNLVTKYSMKYISLSCKKYDNIDALKQIIIEIVTKKTEPDIKQKQNYSIDVKQSEIIDKRKCCINL